MIAHLRGRVASRGAGTVVVDVGGVGYLVHVPATVLLPARGETVELHTSLQVREDSMTLYGFTEPGALELFELLLTSSGVGPRLALAALSTLRPDALRAAVAAEDLATLTQVPGIGKKVAERLVLELKDKVGVAPAAAAEGGQPAPAVDDADAELREALRALGYDAGESQRAIAALHAAGVTGDTEHRLPLALRELSGHVAEGVRR